MATSREIPHVSTPNSSLSDTELAERVRAGDDFAFEELFHRYNAPLCRFSSAIVHDEELGHDLSQETFIKAYSELQKMQGEIYFKRWLYRTASNAAIDHLRRARLIHLLPWQQQKDETDCLTIEGPEHQVEEAILIKMALARVTPKYRPCLILDIFEDMKQQDIAVLLDLSVRSVRRYIYLGKEEVREAYNRLINEYDTSTKRRFPL